VCAGLAPYLDAVARPLAARGIPAGALTAAGFAAGAGNAF